jgi:predicted HD superfamily hydrolase involved in NAD metabolism
MLYPKSDMEELISHYKDFLAKVLTPDRLKHTYGVTQVIQEFAPAYDLNVEKAIIAGLLHDAGKDLSPARQKQLIQESGLVIEPYNQLDYKFYVHGPVGAYLVQKELGITESVIIDAISMHFFYGEGENFNSTFVWCLRFADLLEPNRMPGNKPLPVESEWHLNGKAKLHSLIMSGRLWEAALFQTGWLIKIFEAKPFPIHPNMRKVYQELSSQLKVDDAFWT